MPYPEITDCLVSRFPFQVAEVVHGTSQLRLASVLLVPKVEPLSPRTGTIIPRVLSMNALMAFFANRFPCKQILQVPGVYTGNVKILLPAP